MIAEPISTYPVISQQWAHKHDLHNQAHESRLCAEKKNKKTNWIEDLKLMADGKSVLRKINRS